MIVAKVTDATVITGIIALFFVALALIAFGRAMFNKKNPPIARRFRVGVFIERDHEPEPDEGPPPE